MTASDYISARAEAGLSKTAAVAELAALLDANPSTIWGWLKKEESGTTATPERISRFLTIWHLLPKSAKKALPFCPSSYPIGG